MRSLAFFMFGVLVGGGLACWIVSMSLEGPQNRLDVGGYGLLMFGVIGASFLGGHNRRNER